MSFGRAGLSISVFWFTFFGALGIFFPYYSLYLKENAGLSGTQLGLILSVMPLVGIVAQPFWGQVADRTGARSRVVAFLSMVAAAGFVLLGLAPGFVLILLAAIFLAFFSTPIIPLSVSVALAAFRYSGPHAYGFARSWGTVGFLASVLKSEETDEGEAAGGLFRSVYGYYPAFFAGAVERAIVLVGVRLTVHRGILSTPYPTVNRPGVPSDGNSRSQSGPQTVILQSARPCILMGRANCVAKGESQ